MSSRWRSLIAVGAVDRRPQRWATVAAWTAFPCVLPSIGWRVAMLLGIDVGFADAREFRAADARLYVAGLELAQLAGGLLCLGLVRPWGERLPRLLGGRRVHRLVPVVLGGVAAVTIVLLTVGVLRAFVPVWLGRTDGWVPNAGMSGAENALLVACYVPLLLWSPALVVALVGYWRRREPGRSDVDADLVDVRTRTVDGRLERSSALLARIAERGNPA